VPEFIRRAATILEWEPIAKSPDLPEPREWGAGIPIKYARNRNPRKRVFVLQGVSCFRATGPVENWQITTLPLHFSEKIIKVDKSFAYEKAKQLVERPLIV